MNKKISVYVSSLIELELLIINNSLYNRKSYIYFKCEKCGCECKHQYRKERLIRLLCKKHAKEETCFKKFGTLNPFSSKDILKKAHDTIHNNANARKLIKEKEKIEKKLIKEKLKNEKILLKFGSLENYQIYNNLSSAYSKTLFYWNIKYGSYENALKQKVLHTRESNLKKYGVEWISSTENFLSSTIQTNLKRYGVLWYYLSDDFKLKSSIKKQELYNDPKYRNEKQIFLTCLDRYGSISPLGNIEVLKKVIETNLKNFGVDNPWKIKDILDKCKRRYLYSGIHFDSAPEIAFFIWLTDVKDIIDVDFEYSPDIALQYSFKGESHFYMPDFRVGSLLFEIKGDHFFKDGKMICPYRDKFLSDLQYLEECEKYEAKHQCMLENDVIIMRSSEYKFFIDYVGSAYGRDYLNQFKNTKNIFKPINRINFIN